MKSHSRSHLDCVLGNHAGGPTHFDFGLFAAHQIDESPTAVLALEALCRADAVVENLRGLLFARNRDSNACADRVSIAFDTFEPELCGLWVAPLPCVEGVGSPGICAIHEVKEGRAANVEDDVIAAVLIIYIRVFIVYNGVFIGY